MRIVLMCVVVVLSGATVMAQPPERGGRGGNRQPDMSRFAGPLFAVAADKDSSGDVSAAEWKGFFEKLPMDGEKVDVKGVARQIYVSLMDTNKDGKLQTKDLEAIHKELDANGDGILQRDEAFRGQRGDRGGRGGNGGRGDRGGNGDGGLRAQDDTPNAPKKGDEPKEEPKKADEPPAPSFAARYQGQARMGLISMADADENREVTVEEWKKFMGSLEAKEGTLSDAQIDKLIEGRQASDDEGDDEGEDEGGMRRARRRMNFSFTSMIERAMGDNATKAKVQEIFESLDANGDKALQADELQPQRRRRRPV